VRDGSGAERSGAGEKAYKKKCEGLLPLPPHLASREEGEGGTRGHRGASGISSASVYRESFALRKNPCLCLICVLLEEKRSGGGLIELEGELGTETRSILKVGTDLPSPLNSGSFALFLDRCCMQL